MAITFPSNPSDGDIYSHGGVTYTWDASPGYWKGQFSVPTIPGDVSDLTDTTNSLFDGVFSSLTGKPTTISGYGITDAFDGVFSSLTGKPTTLAGYGITDGGGGGITGIGKASTPTNGDATTVNAGSTAANKNIAIFGNNLHHIRFVTANSAGSFSIAGLSASDPVTWYYVW